MAQLDITFPTLDCAACTITPKMVDTANHACIRLYTLSEVTSVRGEAGNFQVHIRQNPRYVDVSKCTSCGLCFPGCPVVMKNEFDLGLSERKAVYTLFPQAVPNKAAIDRRRNVLVMPPVWIVALSIRTCLGMSSSLPKVSFRKPIR